MRTDEPLELISMAMLCMSMVGGRDYNNARSCAIDAGH